MSRSRWAFPRRACFKRFAAQVAFDPARLAASQARIQIELDSFDSGVAEVDTEVKRKGWFNTAQFPTATFVSSAVKSLGANRYEATGKMTIKGRARDVTVPFAVRQDGGAAVFEGAFTLKRLDYGIGEGAMVRHRHCCRRSSDPVQADGHQPQVARFLTHTTT